MQRHESYEYPVLGITGGAEDVFAVSKAACVVVCLSSTACTACSSTAVHASGIGWRCLGTFAASKLLVLDSGR